MSAADPYEVLGVAEDATTGEIRKAFWKASLLVHPDKCKHSSAAATFDAVKKAAEALMSADSRDKVDAGKRKTEEDKVAAQVMEELERDRQWRIAQGTATEEDMRYAMLDDYSILYRHAVQCWDELLRDEGWSGRLLAT